MPGPTADFWQQKFEAGQTPWDRGAVNPRLAAWADSGELSPCRIAVPGCGSGYEVAELAWRGFEVTAIDYAAAAIERTQARLGALEAVARERVRLVQADALAWQPAEPFDAIWEQACLCALHPDLWVPYAAQLHRWLRPGGTLFALFVQALRPAAAEGLVQGPPYHCDVNAMRALFPAERWRWPKPPYSPVRHPMGIAELPVALTRL
jgi:SAM-dependent methyltransferase